MEGQPIQPELAKALVAFQKIAPVISRGQEGQVGTRKYKYADISDILTEIKVPLADNGLAVTQKLVTLADGRTICRTIIWHESGQMTSSDLEIPLTATSGAQERGAQFTYYRRYALLAELGIAVENDDLNSDMSAGRPVPGVRSPQEVQQAREVASTTTASAAQVRYLRKLGQSLHLSEQEIDAQLAVVLTKQDASSLIKKWDTQLGQLPGRRQ